MRALLITHGQLGAELLNCARRVHDVEAPIEALSNEGQSLDALTESIRDWLAKDEEPALLLVDIGSGSCGVAAQEAARGRERTWVLGGLNLAMILTYLSSHSTLEAEELVAKIFDRALNAVDLLGSEG